MSTRSLLCQKIGNKYKTIYCHQEGYPCYQLMILNKYYSPPFRKDLDKLLSVRLTCIDEKGNGIVGLNLDKDNKDDAVQFFTKSELLKYAITMTADYIYIYDNGIWHAINTDHPILNLEGDK